MKITQQLIQQTGRTSVFLDQDFYREDNIKFLKDNRYIYELCTLNEDCYGIYLTNINRIEVVMDMNDIKLKAFLKDGSQLYVKL